MQNSKASPLLTRSRARLIAGVLIIPISLFSIVITYAFNSHPLYALFPLPTLLIGTAMVTLEMRKRVSP